MTNAIQQFRRIRGWGNRYLTIRHDTLRSEKYCANIQLLGRWRQIIGQSNNLSTRTNGVYFTLGITKYSIVTNSNDSVTLRLMTEHDLAMLYEWLNRSHIVEWWGGEEARPTLADVQEQYLPSVLAQESVTPYIAMLNGEPIGYAQSYVALGSGDGWWEEETDPGVRGIDQSLANASQLGKGLGTKLVRALVELLFNDPEVTKIQTDPSPSNLRAIRCYEKAGFERQGTVTTPDGPAVYMVQTRQAFERTRSDA